MQHWEDKKRGEIEKSDTRSHSGLWLQKYCFNFKGNEDIWDENGKYGEENC